jgi:uncharacterized membrane protein
VTADEAALSVQRIDVDLAANDYQAGLELHALLPSTICFNAPTFDLRLALAVLIAHYKPWWVRGFPAGRDRVSEMLSDEERQCFRSANLFETPPSADVKQWWDQIAQSVRATINDALLQQGRDAEELSMTFERTRLASLGITKEPIHISIDDNDAGFDIRSYDPGPVEPVYRLIEVKSSTMTPPRMVLTRGEWEAALKYGKSYVFHLWALPEQALTEYTVEEIAPHIPADQGVGTWLRVEIVPTAKAVS